MTYNYLNLPQLVHIKGEGNVTYTYDAAGNNLTKVIADRGICVSAAGAAVQSGLGYRYAAICRA